MDTHRLAAGYLEGLVARLVKVLGGVVVLYVGGLTWTTTDGLQQVDVGAVVGALGENLPVLLALLGLGVVYSVFSPAFRKSEKAVRKRGKNPHRVPTAIKPTQNLVVYALQSAVRAVLLVGVGVALVTIEPLVDAGGALTVGGALDAVGRVSLGRLTAAVGIALLLALAWPYTAGTGSSSGGGAGDGDGDGE